MSRTLLTIISPKTKTILALVLRRNFLGDKYNFLTPSLFPLQMGVNFYKKGETIRPHAHKRQRRIIAQTQEFILVAKGSLTLLLYDEKGKLARRVPLREGDCVFLAAGGHGFKVRSKTKLIEIKQGPYLQSKDKVFLAGPDR